METGKLCGLYLSPALKVFNPLLIFNFNYLPLPVNPLLAPAFDAKNVIYTEDRLKPNGAGPKPAPPELPPAVSAYRGLPGDTPDAPPPPPPPGRIPGAAMPEPPPVSGPPPSRRLRRTCRTCCCRARAAAMTARAAMRRVLLIGGCVMLLATGCGFNGLNSLPLPGAVGRGSGASVYHVEIANVGTLEANSPVMVDDVIVGSIKKLSVPKGTWHAVVDVSVNPGVVIPANAVASVGQTSLLGSMHLALNTPLGQPPNGRLQPGATIPLNRSSTYPSTEADALVAVDGGSTPNWLGRSVTSSTTSAHPCPSTRARFAIAEPPGQVHRHAR